MKWRWLLPACVLGLGSVGAQAQAGLYFNPIVTRVSNSKADSGTFAYLGQNSTSALRGGISIGGYYMFGRNPRAKFGLDLRDEWQRGSNSLLNSFLLGVRAQTTVGERLMPYAEVLGGAGTTRAPFTSVSTTRGTFKVYGGLDYAINQHLDIRAIEVGYGTLTTASTGIYNSSVNFPASSLLSFSSGLVVRFGR